MMETENRRVHTPREKGKKISTQPARRRLIKKKTLGWEGICRTAADAVKPWAGRFLLFPALILYLELVLYFYMGMEMRYVPVYFVFSLAAGCLFSALILVLPPRAGDVTMTAEEQAQYVDAMKQLVGYKLDSTAHIVENDFYEIVFGETG